MEKPENLETLWQEVNTQCCKEASLNDMSAWREMGDCTSDGCTCDSKCSDWD